MNLNVITGVICYVRSSIGGRCVDPDLGRHAAELDRAAGDRLWKCRRRHERHSADLQRDARGECLINVPAVANDRSYAWCKKETLERRLGVPAFMKVETEIKCVKRCLRRTISQIPLRS